MHRACRRYVTTAAALIAVLGLAGGSARAQAKEGAWEAAGYLVHTLYNNQTRIGDSTGFGVRGGYYVRAASEIELEYDRSSANSDVDSDVTFDITKISFNYLHSFKPKRNGKLLPLFTFGLGAMNIDDGTHNANSPLFRAGGGLRYYLTPRLNFSFQGRMYRWHGGGDVTIQDSYYSLDLTVGLGYVFGGGK